MSGTIDERVVSLKFDAAQFGQGVKSTLDQLGQLNKGLQLQGATKGLGEFNRNGLASIASGVENISRKFSAMGVAGVAAIATITSKAVTAGITLAKALTIDPVKAGLESYNQQINATQVILANTAGAGTTLKQVTATLAELQVYANLTVYSFSQMTENIGRFTAAGVPLKQATAAIKGLANVAALSGANTQQMSSAMYQMSQALSTGVLRLQDWNSLSNANMAGTNVQKAIEATAHAIGGVSGKNMDAALKKFGNFRQSLQSGWLTSDIFSKAMGVMAGTVDKATGKMRAFSVAELEHQGFAKKDAEALHQLSQAALDSATKIRTIPQLTQALKEEVATAWGQVFKTIFGDINQATTLFSALHTVAENALTGPIYALNKVLQNWAKAGGRTAAIDAIATAFHALAAILAPIKDAFHEIFPPATGKQLADITKAIDNFMHSLVIGSDTADKLKRTFAGVFAVFGIGWDIIKEVAKTLFGLFDGVGSGASSFLDVTASVGDFLVALKNAIEQGQGLHKFFEGLGKVLAVPLHLLGMFADIIGQAFSGVGNIDTSGLDRLNARLSPLAALGHALSTIWGHLTDVFMSVLHAFGPLADKISSGLSAIGDAIQSSFDSGNFSHILDAINTGLFAALVLIIRKFVISFKGIDVSGGIVDSIKASFGQLTDTMTTMQNNIKANTLLKIAGAIGLLTISVVALSLIDSAKLTKALTAMAVMFTQLVLTMAIFTKVAEGGTFVKLPIAAASLILLATAIDLLTIAVAQLAKLDWNGLAKGLTGVTVLLGVLVATMQLMPPGEKMISTGAGLILLAAAIKILASAVTDLSGLSWGEIAKGLVGVGGLLLALGLYSKFADANAAGVLSGAGIVLLAAGIKILASALQDIGQMSWGEIAKGLVTLAGALLLIAAALKVIPPSSVLSAAAIFIVAASLSKIGDALAAMGQMQWGQIAKGLVSMAGALALIAAALALLPASSLLSAAAIFIVASSLGMIADALGKMGAQTWGEIAKGLVTLAGALAIIAGAMLLMTGALPGAAALIVVAAALAILTPVLVTLGSMSWGEIAKGLATLAAAFTIFGIAGLLLTPVVPTLLGLGAAIALIGAGVALAGVGVLALSVGLTALAVSGAAAGAAVVVLITTIAKSLPTLATGMADAMVAFITEIAKHTPAAMAAFTVMVTALLTTIEKLTPKILHTVDVLLTAFLNLLVDMVPKVYTAGIKILTGILNGIAANIGKLVKAGANVIIKFLQGVAAQAGPIATAAAKAIVTFINGLANAIENNISDIRAAGLHLAFAIIDGMTLGLAGGAARVAGAAIDVAKGALGAAAHALGIHSPSKEFYKLGQYSMQGFALGLKSGDRGSVLKTFDDMKNKLRDVLASSSKDVEQAAAKLKKLKDAHDQNAKAIRAATAALAQAKKEHRETTNAYVVLTKRLVDERNKLAGLASSYQVVTDKLKAAQDALDAAKKTRDDFATSTADAFDNLPDLTGDTQVSDFISGLQQQIADTITFAKDLQKLRDAGLSDKIYKELLGKGTGALPFVQQLLDGGADMIKQVDDLGNQLDSASKDLGTSASTALYQAGVDAAQGLVDGLAKQQAAIQLQMNAIATYMVNAIKAKLGIKSPSKVFAQIGEYAGQGLVQGLESYSGVVAKSAEGVGQDAILALRKSITGLPDLLGGDFDLAPTIRPVLDLTDVVAGAARISKVLAPTPIGVSAAYSAARDVESGFNANAAAMPDHVFEDNSTHVSLTQNNSSPKALSDAEIYRQTKNQLSVVKKVVDK